MFTADRWRCDEKWDIVHVFFASGYHSSSRLWAHWEDFVPFFSFSFGLVSQPIDEDFHLASTHTLSGDQNSAVARPTTNSGFLTESSFRLPSFFLLVYVFVSLLTFT